MTRKKHKDKSLKDDVDMVKENNNDNQLNESENENLSEQENGTQDNVLDKCGQIQKEKEEIYNKYLRLMAEFENYRRRNDKERINWIKNANEKLCLKICDVLDDFERALDIQPDAEQWGQFYKGIESIFNKLGNLLSSEGLQKIESLRKEFDPMYHEAISYIPSDEPVDTIVSVIQNGYIMNDKIIRAAKVAVSAGNEKTE